MKQKIKIIVPIVVGILTTGLLVSGCSSFKNEGDVHFQVDNYQVNTTVSKK